MRRLVLEVLGQSLRYAKLIDQHGVSDGSEHGDLSIWIGPGARFHSLYRPLHVRDMGEPDIHRVPGAVCPGSSDEKHVAAGHIGYIWESLASFPAWFKLAELVVQ